MNKDCLIAIGIFLTAVYQLTGFFQQKVEVIWFLVFSF